MPKVGADDCVSRAPLLNLAVDALNLLPLELRGKLKLVVVDNLRLGESLPFRGGRLFAADN